MIIAQSLGDVPTSSSRLIQYRVSKHTDLPLHTHQYPLATEKQLASKNKRCSIKYSVLFLYIITLVLLRAWLSLKYLFHHNKHRRIVNTKYNPSLKKILFFFILSSLPTLVEATPTETEAVRIIQNCWLAYLAYRTTLFQYTPTLFSSPSHLGKIQTSYVGVIEIKH